MLSNTPTVFTFRPHFDDTTPPDDALIWCVRVDPETALSALDDLRGLYLMGDALSPRVAGMLETDGDVTLYLWPRVIPDARLLLVLLDYGAARVADLGRLHGECWISGELLGRVLAAIATKRCHAEE